MRSKNIRNIYRIKPINILNSSFKNKNIEIKPKKRKSDRYSDEDEYIEIESENLNYAVAKGIKVEKKINIIKKKSIWA